MSTIKVTTIQDIAGANSSTTEAIANGIAKAWINFNGTETVAIRAAFNVSTIADNGTGDYTVNFTMAMPDTNYAVTMSGNAGVNGTGEWAYGTRSHNTTDFSINFGDNNNDNSFDAALCCASVFR